MRGQSLTAQQDHVCQALEVELWQSWLVSIPTRQPSQHAGLALAAISIRLTHLSMRLRVYQYKSIYVVEWCGETSTAACV